MTQSEIDALFVLSGIGFGEDIGMDDLEAAASRPQTLAGLSITLQIDQRQFKLLNDKLDILGQEHAGIQRALNEILDYLHKLQVAKGFHLTIKKQGETDMAGKAKLGRMKLDLQDDKNGTVSATVVDTAGLSTTLSPGTSVPVIVSSDPSAIVVDQSGDPSGLTGTFKAATPAKLATGVTLSISATDPSGAVLTGPPSEGINVVAGPAGGFNLTLAGS